MCAKKMAIKKDEQPEEGPPAPRTTGWPHGSKRWWGDTARTEVRDDGLMDDEITLRILRSRMTWKEWVLYDFLRYWYGIGALALLCFSVTYISWRYHVHDVAGLAVLAVGAVVLIVLEVLLYRAIWPGGAFTVGWPAGKRLRMVIRRLRWRL
jgi:hypothetical protein